MYWCSLPLSLWRGQSTGYRGCSIYFQMRPARVRPPSEEVLEAIDEQSVIGRPGRLGQSSGKKAQSMEYVLTYKGRYNKPEEYENIIVKANPEGEIIRLKDLAEVELGSEFFDIYSNKDGYPSASIVLKQNFGSNASDVI